MPNMCPMGETPRGRGRDTKRRPMTTDDDNATTWRDLADQLTPAQIARFDHAEQLCITGAHLAFPQNDLSKTIADMLDGVLKEARWEAQQNLAD